MDEYLIGQIIPLEDEDGNEVEFEVLDAIEYEGTHYLALEKAGLGVEDDIELLIMKHDAEDPEVLLVVDAFDDEDEYDVMYQIFAERLDEMYDEEEGDEEEGDEE